VLSGLHALQDARGHLFPFVPVLVGIGIGTWFALPFEPGAGVYAGAAALVLVALAGRLVLPDLLHIPALAVLWLAVGLLAAGARGHLVAAPVLEFRVYGPVEGRIIEVDRSRADHLRLTLDRLRVTDLPADRTPHSVRVSLHADQPHVDLAPGLRVMLTANLSPPQPPAEPGAFDFRRIAWFERLGGVGYSRTPVLVVEEADPRTQLIDRLRTHLSGIVQDRIPGQAGAFAAGAVTGDRSGITQDTVTALRDSNLAHLLAISGMNLAFLVGFVFALVRTGIALVPPLALRVNGKKIAALAALPVAAFYLALSGGNVATERAFLMVAVMLVAVLADRQAVSLRAVAIAALIILLWKPEELLNAGFQMSMAATVALVAGFAALRDRVNREKVPRWMLPVYAAVLSTVIAGLATAPLAAAHFNRFTDYGMLANLLTVPAMGTFVMPGAVIAALLGPIGLGAPGFWLMEIGSRWILAVAHWIAGWEGSVTGILAPGPLVLPILTLGVLWVILWRGPARAAGALPVLAAMVLWAMTERPPVLVSADGALSGVLADGPRSLSHDRGAGFAAELWLERYGDLAAQDRAAARRGFRDGQGGRLAEVGGVTILHLKGRSGPERLPAACDRPTVVILSEDVVPPDPPGCTVLDADRLAALGGAAIWPADGVARIVAARGPARLWSPAPRVRAPRGAAATTP
jgi:competence protein ComEC